MRTLTLITALASALVLNVASADELRMRQAPPKPAAKASATVPHSDLSDDEAAAAEPDADTDADAADTDADTDTETTTEETTDEDSSDDAADADSDADDEPVAAPLQASEVEVKSEIQAAPTPPAPSAVALPKKGQTMAEVVKAFGEPKKKHAPAGGDSPRHPAITRWDYAQFSVFFEKNRVINSVNPLQPPALQHTDKLKPLEY